MNNVFLIESLLNPKVQLAVEFHSSRLKHQVEFYDNPGCSIFFPITIFSQFFNFDTQKNMPTFDTRDSLLKWISHVLPAITMLCISKMPYSSETKAVMKDNLEKIEKAQWHRMATLVLGREAGGRSSFFDDWFEELDACCVDMSHDLNDKQFYDVKEPGQFKLFEVDVNDRGDYGSLGYLVKTAMIRAKTHIFKHPANVQKMKKTIEKVAEKVTMKMVLLLGTELMEKVLGALESNDLDDLETWLPPNGPDGQNGQTPFVVLETQGSVSVRKTYDSYDNYLKDLEERGINF